MRIAVTSGYSKSLHAAALIVALRRAGHDVSLCLNVRLLSAGRFRFYARQLGWRRLWDKFRSRTRDSDLSKTAGRGELDPLRDWMGENSIDAASVTDACRIGGTTLHHVADLNCAAAIRELKSRRPDLVVYAGGGIVRKSFLETPRIGVLNAHGGPLPRFRGMNAAEWSVLHGVAPSVCVILLDAGIDTGPIVLETPIPLAPCVDVPTLRGWGTRMSVIALLEAVEKIAQPGFTPTPQDKSAGRQHFIMAPALLPIVERRLAALR